MQQKHLNQKELARRWNISHRTLERWRWAGQGPHFLKIGGRVVYRAEDILAFEREQLRQSTLAPALTGTSGTGSPSSSGD
jgi:predicted site-specific integrase-resolvase